MHSIFLGSGKATPAEERPALRHLTNQLSALAGLMTSMTGLAVLIGWQFHFESLKRVSLGLVSMNPVTAVCFLLLGVALFLSGSGSYSKPISRLCAGIVATAGLSRLSDIFLGSHFGADRYLYTSHLTNAVTGIAGGMATATALCFVSIGIAMLLISTRTRHLRMAGQASVIFVLLISLMAVVGYTYGAARLYALDNFSMALNTAGTFLLLTIGTLCRQNFGAMAPFKSPLLGGRTARRLMILNVAFPFLLGLACVYGFSDKSINLATATAIFVVANICALVAVTAVAAHRLDQLASSLSDRTAELEQARAIADTANRTKSNFLANMSHEMRTPMNGILGMLEILGYTQLEQDQCRIVSTIRTSARTLLDLLNDILDFSKIEANQLSIESVNSDVAEIVESAGKLFLGAAAAKGITIRCFTGASLRGQFLTDPVRVRQIIGNLISNSVKFTSEGMVTVSANVVSEPQEGTKLRITIEDTGVGISEEAQKRLFQPFVQADDSTARRFGGTGLGLSICLRLVKLMGGSITLDSVLGAGSRVTVELPVKPAAAENSAPSVDLHGVKVAIIGADETENRYFSDDLTYWRAQVRVAEIGSLDQDLLDCAVILAPLGEEENIRRAVTASGFHNDLRRFVFYSFEDAAHDRHSVAKDALYTTALSRARIVTAVAVAAGRKSPEVEMIHGTADRELGIAAPDRQAAVQTGQLILLAEDHPLNRDVILRQLRLLGFAADAVENGVAALAALRNTRYALVLTDCNMPEMDGFALTRAIRTGEDNLKTLPIIALTANAMAGESQRCLSAGMDAYLSKPVTLSDLRACLTRWLPQAEPGGKSQDSLAVVESRRCEGADKLDLTLLRDCFGDDNDAIAANLSIFLAAMETDLKDLAQAVEQNNEDQIRHTAHRIKGAARFVGGSQLVKASEALETSAAEKNWPEINTRWPQLISAGQDIGLEI